MSYSPYDIIMGLGDSGSLPTDGESEPQSSLDDSNMIVSSHEDTTSDFDTMSLNSDTLQDFGSLVSLPPGTLLGLFRGDESEDGEQTIVSSAPSGGAIPAPVASPDTWAISPHPQMLPGSTQSISTVCTDTVSYERLLNTATSDLGDDDDGSETPANRALVPVSSTDSYSTQHDPVSFMAVANNLMRDSTNSARWFNRFSEHDWDQFRDAARMLLMAIDPPLQSLPLPPMPPRALMGPMITNASYEAKDLLPEAYVCTLCNDAIVGAMNLDCGCSSPTVCTPCWEQHDSSMVSNQLGFVWVEQRRCPSCHECVTSSVPANTFDIEVLQMIQTLDPDDPRVCSLKQSYCSRLEAWRATVEEMNEEHHRDESTRRDNMLAQLLQEEETFFWKKRQVQLRCRQRLEARSMRLLFLGQTAIALLAATLTSAGLKAIARK